MSQPEIVFRHGMCSAAIFAKEVTHNGRTFLVRNVVFQKRYRDQSGEWQSTSTLSINDIPKATLVLGKAFEYLTANSYQSEGEGE